MIKTFFIGDTHFSHKNVLLYEPQRPGTTIEEHNEILVDLWNKEVRPQDTVFHLGDFCFGLKNLPIAGRLNGKKRLVMGNHDVYAASEYLKYFHSLHGAIFYRQFILTHIPSHPNHMYAKANIHGHLHSKLVMNENKPDPYYINVSVERIGFKPISLEEIMEIYNERYLQDEI